MIINSILPNNPKQWIKDNPDQLGILIMRSLLSLVWISQAFAKILLRNNNIYYDHNEFLGNLNYMRVTNPIGFIRFLLKNFLIPNYEIILVIVIITELFIGISLGLGLFTRLGALFGGLMTINLWILTLGWDEWIWTYPLIFFPHVMFFLARSGQQIGIDRILITKNNNCLISKLI